MLKTLLILLFIACFSSCALIREKGDKTGGKIGRVENKIKKIEAIIDSVLICVLY